MRIKAIKRPTINPIARATTVNSSESVNQILGIEDYSSLYGWIFMGFGAALLAVIAAYLEMKRRNNRH